MARKIAWLQAGLYGSMAFSSLSNAVLFNPQNDFQPISWKNSSFPVDLEPHLNNRAFGMTPNDANFDASGSEFCSDIESNKTDKLDSYPAQYMPSESFVYGGANYKFPSYKESGYDNVITDGQEIKVPKGRYFSVRMLAASESGMASATINATYADGSTDSGALLVPAWWTWPYPAGGDLIFPHYLTDTARNYNRSNIFQTINWLDSSKELVSLTLPNDAGGSSTEPGGDEVDTKLHVFALSLVPITAGGSDSPQLEIQYARSTQKWVDGTDKAQIIEVSVNNVGSEFLLRDHAARIRVESPGLETVAEGTLTRLAPGDQAKVEIGVKNKSRVKAGEAGPATVVISGEGVESSKYTFKATYGIRPYEATHESIYAHESPNWFNDAKYGIFIHWGPYSVPAWGSAGENETYAEW